jgi:4-hydroxy-3-methylbut-2-enyl diphosphate reductase
MSKDQNSKPARVNLRTPEVMERVQEEVERHYRSTLVEQIRASGGSLKRGHTSIRLAKEFGFCYGVERAIDLAYAARKVFPDNRLFLVGEIIHNPDVNEHMASMGIEKIGPGGVSLDVLDKDDVVILPAFGAEIKTIERIRERGCRIVDTTCGDVMSVWRRVRQNAREGVTSIIHGKPEHEETRATASRAAEDSHPGHYLVVLNLEETDRVCRYMTEGGDREEFLHFFAGACSEGFDPDLHLHKVGVANQTTMLRSETEEVQRRIREAVAARDAGSTGNFRFFDTICGATQDRQDALFHLLSGPLDILLVVGGYNSSNTTHLVEIGEKRVPTYFVRDVARLESEEQIRHFDIHKKQEIVSRPWLPSGGEITVGITAGASCPNNLIEEIIHRIFTLRHEATPQTSG